MVGEDELGLTGGAALVQDRGPRQASHRHGHGRGLGKPKSYLGTKRSRPVSRGAAYGQDERLTCTNEILLLGWWSLEPFLSSAC